MMFQTDYWLPGFTPSVLILLAPIIYLWIKYGIEIAALRIRYELKRRYG